MICKPLLKLGKDFWKSISIIYNFLSRRKKTKKEEMVINSKYKAPDKEFYLQGSSLVEQSVFCKEM